MMNRTVRTKYSNGWIIEMRVEDPLLVTLKDPNGDELDSVEFHPEVWKRPRGRTQIKNFITETMAVFADDYDTVIPLCKKDDDGDLEIDLKKFKTFMRKVGETVEEEKGSTDVKETDEPSVPDLMEIDREGKAQELLEDPDLILTIDDVIHEKMAGEHMNSMLNFIVCLSCLVPEPINLRWSGRSAVGKSAIATAVIRVFPNEMKMVYVGMTRKSMYYDPSAVETEEGRLVDLSGKILLILEESNALEFLEEAKPILSHDMWEHRYPFTETGGKKIETKYVTLRGWPAYVGLSVDPQESVELGTRELTSSPKMGSDKYGRVVDWKKLEKWTPWFKPDEERLDIVRRAISKLDRETVWIPYLDILRKYFPARTARSQRDWERLVSVVETVALLYQRQRPRMNVEGEEMIVAHPFDALVALYAVELALMQAMVGLSYDQVKFYRCISERSQDSEKRWWTYKDLMREYGREFGESITRDTVQRRYVDPLVNEGLMEKDKSEKEHKMTVSSPITSFNLLNLRKLKAELSDMELSEEYMRGQFLRANREKGVNPTHPEMKVGKPMSLEAHELEGEEEAHELEEDTENTPLSFDPSYEDVISELVSRIGEEEGKSPLDWLMRRLKGSDNEISEIDLTGESGDGAQEDKASAVMTIIRDLEDEYSEGIPIENIKAEAESEGIDTGFVDEFLKRGKREGRLYVPSEGEILTAVR